MPEFRRDEVPSPHSKADDGERQEQSAKVPGDRDEAKSLPDDVAARAPGSPDADLHHPAAASADTDGEAGSAEAPMGRIEPLKRR